MRKAMFALLALAISLFGTQCWAGTCSGSEGLSCTNTFSPADTTGTFDFSATGDGVLTVQFVTVLTPNFTLTVTVAHPTNPLPLDPNEFPAGTVCVPYSSNFNLCDRYDFSGNPAVTMGPNGVPVRNVDYKGLITLTLRYFYTGPIHTPAFGHAPGDVTTFTEDILANYSAFPTGCVGPSCEDPTMDGDTPGLSSVIALDEPGPAPASYCFVSPTPFQTFSAALSPVIEVIFQFSSDPSGACPINGTPLRDKTAHVSLSKIVSGKSVFVPILDKEEANKFHWDNKNGLNEFDLSTVGLATGTTYTITVRSSEFSPPQRVSFTLNP